MDEDKAARTNSEAEEQEQPQAEPPAVPQEPQANPPARDAGWAGAPTSQVVRTCAAALLTAVVVLVALFLLWQVRTFVGWFVIALSLAVVHKGLPAGDPRSRRASRRCFVVAHRIRVKPIFWPFLFCRLRP